MTMHETAVLFDCEGDELVGVITAPEATGSDLGVLVIVGGPQYRVGSHRQFVLLARGLAKAGFPCMRFDYRGMGDSMGEARSFDDVNSDLRAALNAFLDRMPGVRRVVLWGLCDGASAACSFAPTDDRVAGMVLLNPWVKTDTGEAKTMLRHYYLRRLLSRSFWAKLLSGGVSVRGSLGGLNGAVARARGRNVSGESRDNLDLPGKMAVALHRADKPFVVFLSERDYVAREFEQVVRDGAWEGLVAAREPQRIAGADHTFSSAVWRGEVETKTAEWVGRISATPQSRKSDQEAHHV
ncbi:MAG: hydrolase 1, exosortase A system-associated [Azoarcus sp.]|nr:hydrolase 1, exosortase A system-associated [Azoarcus sp.]